MATLYVRNVPEELHAALRRRAEEKQTSISTEVVRLLMRGLEFAPAAVEEFLDEVETGRPRVRPGAPSVADLIRADREAG